MSKNAENNVKFRTSVGGQALIEGIMMRGPEKQAIVCRTEFGLVKKVRPLKFISKKYPILGLPIIRGSVNFISSMVTGIKALTYSAELLPEDQQEQPSKFDMWIEKKVGVETAEKIIVAIAVILGICVSVGLFILLPTILAGLLDGLITVPIVRNLLEGLLRIIIFLAYMWLATRMKDIRRVWEYHGAEHKAIFCYEKGLPLTVENARLQPRQHPRCGTNFLFITMIVSILVFSLVRWTNIWGRMLLRIVLLPIVVGISYELIKWAGRSESRCSRILSAPGKALQLLTTREPDDSMLEVAIEALKLVIPENKDEALW